HDLRNILAEAMLAADTLEARADAGTARYAAKVNTALDRATALCQESLRFARDGAPVVDRRRFALAELIDAVALETARLAPDGARGWVKAFNPLIDLYADREQVRRVLENLGRNAFEAGARTVTISAERIDADGVAYGLLLADDGPGVPDDIRPTLFDPFASRDKPGGTGLGLAIVRDIARAHEGDAEFVPTARGAGFRVSFG
ncbi:MAG: HAMP domain-containing sensor histidine kinase, partial [Pseudomonadota bacterium]